MKVGLLLVASIVASTQHVSARCMAPVVRSEPLEAVLYLPSRAYPYGIEKKSVRYGEVAIRETRECRDVLTPTYSLSDMIVFEVAPMDDACAQYQSGRDRRWLAICHRNR